MPRSRKLKPPTKAKAAPVPGPRTKANLTLRTLTPRELAALDGIKAKARIATDAGAIARAITDWDSLRSKCDATEQRYEELETLVHDYVNASGRAQAAMDAEAKGLSALLAFTKRPRTVPRQLLIAVNDY